MAIRVNINDQMRRYGIGSLMNINQAQADQMSMDFWRQSGLLGSNWMNAQGKSTAQFAQEKSQSLQQYKGFYDTAKYNQLVTGLGGTTSDTLLKRISARQTDNARFLNMMSDYNSFKSWYNSVGGIDLVTDQGFDADFGLNGQKGTEERIQMRWMSMQKLGQALNQEGTNLSNELSAQFGREQNFLSGVTGLTQTATQAKMKADQAAAAAKLNEQYAQNQAALNASAQKNDATLAAQKAAQEKQFAEAQAAADKAAAQQQEQLNTTAQVTAVANAAQSAKEQTSLAVQNLETRANTLQGNVIVTTNANQSTKSAAGLSRTDRWLSRRSPGAGGGGANV